MHQRIIQLSNPKKLVFKDCLIRKFQNKTETVSRKIKDWISGFSALLCSLFKTLTSWWPVLLPVWPLALNWCLPTSVRHVKFDHFYSFWSRKLALQFTSSKETIKELRRATLFSLKENNTFLCLCHLMEKIECTICLFKPLLQLLCSHFTGKHKQTRVSLLAKIAFTSNFLVSCRNEC